MRYSNITRGVFLRRPNRFIAEVELDGHKETVHVKNTGRCRELLVPGCEVWLTAPGTPGRKTKYDLVAVRKSDGVLYNIDSQAPNKVVLEWLQRQEGLKVTPEYTYGDSRVDFYMEKIDGGSDRTPGGGSGRKPGGGGPCRYLMEVKGCTLEVGGVGYFPDAPTQRGVKHIRELIKAKKEGYQAILGFVIQMDGVTEVRPNADTDPEFGAAMAEAVEAGVEITFFTCHVEPDSLEITAELRA